MCFHMNNVIIKLLLEIQIIFVLKIRNTYAYLLYNNIKLHY